MVKTWWLGGKLWFLNGVIPAFEKFATLLKYFRGESTKALSRAFVLFVLHPV
jgi:hypothetical protein